MADPYEQGTDYNRPIRASLGGLGAANLPATMTITQRVAELSKRITESGHMLMDARQRFTEAARHKEQCEVGFAQTADQLMRALNELREGVPEGVPYQS